MTMTDEKTPSGGAGREAVEALVASGGLDGLFEQINSGQVALTGSDGLLPALLKETLERGLQAELTDHLGYDKGERAPAARGNARNGSSVKTMDSEVGPFEIEVPRDRAGTFTPRLVRKGQRRMDGLDGMIISLYAGGMTVREIRHHLESTLGVELSAGTISNITDAVADAVLEWQRRPLEEFYPVIYLDAIRVKIRDQGRVSNRAAHIAVGVDMEGVKHVLGIWVQADEGASFWAHVCAELANRGIQDVLIVEGAPPARSAARGGMRRADGPCRSGRGDVARLDGADLRGAPDPLLDEVRVLRGPQEGRSRPQARLHRLQRRCRRSGPG